MTPPNPSFFVWAHTLINGIQFQQLGVYSIFGTLGIVAHYFKKWLNDEIEKGIVKYLFINYPKRTLASYCTFLASGVTYIYTGTADSMSWPALIGLAFTTGFSIDSTMNKADAKTPSPQIILPDSNQNNNPPSNG